MSYVIHYLRFFAYILCIPFLYAYLNRVERSINITSHELSRIRTRWEIDKYPLFLKSPSISQTSWEVMKLKYESKILRSLVDTNANHSFIASFMGSSVAAGHDSPFNASYPILVGEYMKLPLKSIGIDFESRNVAIGNNPCLPYDACPRTFAGVEADLVHWEQTYNCNPEGNKSNHIFELFIRQVMQLPASPVIVFSESVIPNWDEKECADINTKTHTLSNEETELAKLLEMVPSDIAPLLNRISKSYWSELTFLANAYKTAGIQVWSHGHYADNGYKCKGPYVSKWGCCSATWHPSLLGHELVASHFAYFWLLIFKDALFSVRSSLTKYKRLDRNTIEDLLREDILKLDKRIQSEHRHIPLEAIYPSNIIDNIQCFTSFEPRYDSEGDLLSLVLPIDNKTTPESFENLDPFKIDIYENLTRPDIILRSQARGYQDRKYMLYGNNNSMPLNLKINIRRNGTAFICQPPSDWNKHPVGFSSLWVAKPLVYLSENAVLVNQESDEYVYGKEAFTFDKKRKGVKILTYYRPNPSDDLESICVEIIDRIPIGNHVLTIIPSDISYIMVSYLLLP